MQIHPLNKDNHIYFYILLKAWTLTFTKEAQLCSQYLIIKNTPDNIFFRAVVWVIS